ncbi:VWA domain-containing protein [Eubacterium limosum]|uniref:VWA domain-containing protein n=1 Tax=Eubacterium limosum TaxID=1736 RepID=UPI00106352AD|nr:VWA domain-containing protein [Eubacterium limosum]
MEATIHSEFMNHLAETLMRFAAFMEAHYQFAVYSDHLLRFATAVSREGAVDPKELKFLLKPYLCQTREQGMVFERAFDFFFFQNQDNFEEICQTDPQLSRLLPQTKENAALKKLLEKKSHQEKYVKVYRRSFILSGDLKAMEALCEKVRPTLDRRLNRLPAACEKYTAEDFDNAKTILSCDWNALIERYGSINPAPLYAIYQTLLTDNLTGQYHALLNQYYDRIIAFTIFIFNPKFIAENKRRQNKVHELQQQVNRCQQLSGIDGPVVGCWKSQNHRMEFIGGCRSNLCDQANPEHNKLIQPFKTLNKKEQGELRNHIIKASNQLRDILRLNLQGKQRKRLDMKRTIRASIKTMGIPAKLVHHLEKPRKVRIVSILDISGSCSHVTQMMLFFLHELQNVFLGGAETFVFVNSLIPVTDIIRTSRPEELEKKVMEKVPTKGVYSDYGKPIQELWQQYPHVLNAETIVLWLGDARNNSRADHCEEMQKIASVTHKMYWLNPDQPHLWGEGDSVINRYAPYMEGVYHVENLLDIVNFLRDMRY